MLEGCARKLEKKKYQTGRKNTRNIRKGKIEGKKMNFENTTMHRLNYDIMWKKIKINSVN